ncbi:hypothetical protein QQ045_004390 [Rhodiola kirilowii]
MRNTKISPATIHGGEFSWNDRNFDEDHNDVKKVKEYDARHARSMFLRSYHFSEDKEGWKKMVKKKVKEINMKARLVLMDMRREVVFRRKFSVKVIVVRVDFPMASVCVKCFVPTIRKKTE